MPPDLVAEQEKVWRPYIDWCGEKFGAALRASSGVVPFEQNRPALASLRAFIETLDVFFLTGLSAACGALGSLVLGLALLEGRADATAVFEAAELEALWQIRKWGEDPASQSRHVDIKRDIETCAQWVALLRK
jgi:chaperone required for assembly of F1-ATPase